MADNGSGRLDRIEAALERLTEAMQVSETRFNLMVDHHDAEFRSLMKWQVATQSSLEDLIRQQKVRDQQVDERIDKLVGAIGELLRTLPKPVRGPMD